MTHSSAESAPGLLRIASGTPILPMSWRSAPSWMRRTWSALRRISSAIPRERAATRAEWLRVYGSRASTAAASARTDARYSSRMRARASAFSNAVATRFASVCRTATSSSSSVFGASAPQARTPTSFPRLFIGRYTSLGARNGSPLWMTRLAGPDPTGTRASSTPASSPRALMTNSSSLPRSSYRAIEKESRETSVAAASKARCAISNGSCTAPSCHARTFSAESRPMRRSRSRRSFAARSAVEARSAKARSSRRSIASNDR